MDIDLALSDDSSRSPEEPGELPSISVRLCHLTRRHRWQVQRALEPLFSSGTELDRAVRHVLLARGKRVRASLALIASEAAGRPAADALPVAVAFELLHTASLIHDDIMDDEQMRRGRACVHHLFGTGLAITAGDLLIFEAYRRLLSLFDSHPAQAVERVLAIFTACAARTCRGQALDLRWTNALPSTRRYLTMIRAKTGSMIEAPIECAAVLAQAPRSSCERFRQYGRYLGTSFQIADDAIDDPEAGVPLKTKRQLAARCARRSVRALEGVGHEPARTQLATIANVVGHWKVPAPPPICPPSQGDMHVDRSVAFIEPGCVGI